MEENQIGVLKEQSKYVWDKVYKMYPNIDEVLKNLHTKQLELYDLLDELDEKYPVDGYNWECDPNKVLSGAKSPFYLCSVSTETKIEENYKSSLAKQLLCVDGKHHFIKIEHDIEWCKYCGTLKKLRYTEDFINVGQDILFPEAPHFLPKKEV